jgi:hypothetical protein
MHQIALNDISTNASHRECNSCVVATGFTFLESVNDEALAAATPAAGSTRRLLFDIRPRGIGNWGKLAV